MRFLDDLRHAIKALRGAPGFTLGALSILALAIGANTTIFSAVSGALLSVPPVPEPERVLVMGGEPSFGGGMDSVSIPYLLEWRRELGSFEHLGGARFESANLTGVDQPVRLNAVQVLGDYFAAIGPPAARGRSLTAEETGIGAERQVVVSHRLWHRSFAADPDLVGKSIQIDDAPFEVVGVMPEDYPFPNRSVDVWLPMGVFAESLPWDHWSSRPGLLGVGRLADGASLSAARSEATALRTALLTRHDEVDTPVIHGLFEYRRQRAERALWLMMGAVALVLLVACTNVAGLLLARAERRRQEIAVRQSLGAPRTRLVRQLFLESLLLALGGGGLGLLVASWASELLVPRVLRQVRMPVEAAIDGRVIVFAIALTLATAVLFGLGPALAATRSKSLNRRLGSRLLAGGRRSSRARSVLVVAETALAVMLLVGAGLLTQSLVRLSRVDPGFEAEEVLAVGVSHSPRVYTSVGSWSGLLDRVLERVAAIPGVESVAMNDHLPLSGSTSSSSTLAEGAPRDDDDAYVSATVEIVSPGYHRTLGIPLLSGRDFNAGDHGEALPVAVVSQSLADLFWPGESALGKRLDLESFEDEDPLYRTVVGVVGDVRRYGLDQPSQPALYLPHWQPSRWSQDRLPEMTLVASTTGDPMALLGAIREAVRGVDPNLPLDWPRTLEAEVARSTSDRRLWSTLLTLFAGCALLLAAIGLYGVLAFAVGNRTREIGVRLALGADARRILSTVLGEGMILVAIGALSGLLLAVLSTRLLSGLLFGIAETDPSTYVGVALVVGAVALLACAGPALRAARVQPVVALRES